MADTKTIIQGALEDEQGRVLHPETEATQVSTTDGKTVETKLAELLAEFSKYLPKNGGGTISAGNLKIYMGHLIVGEWASISSGSDGLCLIAQNAYKDKASNRYYYENTHTSIGARGILLKPWGGSIQYFDTGSIATTAGQEFTPEFKDLIPPTHYASTVAPASTQGADGDIWDVYV